MSITITLTGQISITDGSSGAVALQKQVSSVMVAGSAFSQVQSLAIGTSSISLTLPVTPVQFVYLKNLHSTQSVAVTWTTPAGGSQFIATLEPSAILVFSETNPGAGITALSLQASGAGTSVELIIGG